MVYSLREDAVLKSSLATKQTNAQVNFLPIVFICCESRYHLVSACFLYKTLYMLFINCSCCVLLCRALRSQDHNNCHICPPSVICQDCLQSYMCQSFHRAQNEKNIACDL